LFTEELKKLLKGIKDIVFVSPFTMDDNMLVIGDKLIRAINNSRSSRRLVHLIPKIWIKLGLHLLVFLKNKNFLCAMVGVGGAVDIMEHLSLNW